MHQTAIPIIRTNMDSGVLCFQNKHAPLDRMELAHVVSISLQWPGRSRCAVRQRHRSASRQSSGRIPIFVRWGPRYMNQRFQAVVVIARHFGGFNLFITLTCNPSRPDITQELMPGQTSANSPDLIVRVFTLYRLYGKRLSCRA